MNLRLEIRRILEEALATKHFKERMYDRLESDATNFRAEKPEVKQRVKSAIEFIEQVNFPGQDNIGILLMKGPNKYVYHQVVDGKTEHSEGSFVWAVVRANDMETIVFGDSVYRPKNTQIHLNIDRLRNYVMEDKGGDFNLTEKDLKRLLSPVAAKPAEPAKEQLPVVIVDGIKYVVDVKNESIYKKNNPREVSKIWDVISNFDEAAQEAILSYFQ